MIVLVGLARSCTLRPIVVTKKSILLRAGLLWSVELPRETIVRASFAHSPFPNRFASGYVRITGIGDPKIVIELRESVRVEGLFCRSKMATFFGVAADQPRELMAAINAMMDAGD